MTGIYSLGNLLNLMMDVRQSNSRYLRTGLSFLLDSMASISTVFVLVGCCCLEIILIGTKRRLWECASLPSTQSTIFIKDLDTPVTDDYLIMCTIRRVCLGICKSDCVSF